MTSRRSPALPTRPGGTGTVAATSVSYLLEQRLRYEYPGPIFDLHHRLVVVPPRRHGHQVRRRYHLAVDGPPDAVVRAGRDAVGNHVHVVRAGRVDTHVEFAVTAVLDVAVSNAPASAPDGLLGERRLTAATALTRPDPVIQAEAARLVGAHPDPIGRAESGCSWARQALRYQWGVTSVATTASEALSLGVGVCQDYAHVLLALLRSAGVACRYVSGHLVGEGGTHAWVEALLPAPNGNGYVAWPFDPTHGTEPGLSYITVATGRDYGDVAPTSGTFRGPHGGQLSTRKRAGVTALEYFGTPGEPARATL